jgi:hypothetical protein
MTERRVTTDPSPANIAWPPTHSIRPQPPLTQTPTIDQIGTQNIPQNRVIRAVRVQRLMRLMGLEALGPKPKTELSRRAWLITSLSPRGGEK